MLKIEQKGFADRSQRAEDPRAGANWMCGWSPQLQIVEAILPLRGSDEVS